MQMTSRVARGLPGKSFLAAAMMALLVAGCGTADSQTAERAGTGAAVGAVTGGVIGAFSGSWGKGALAGAAIGGAGGYLYDQVKKDQ